MLNHLERLKRKNRKRDGSERKTKKERVEETYLRCIIVI